MLTNRRFAAIGEVMLELRHQSATHLALGFAGDTFNVAVYLARYQQKAHVEVSYVTALGDDPYSNMILTTWQQEHIKSDLVVHLKGKLPGLYFIQTDPSGERKFYYYRSQSAARDMFKDANNVVSLQATLSHFDDIYFSGITLAILDEASLEILFDLLHKAKQNQANIIFDTNYRPALWPNLATAQRVIQKAISYTTIALPTYDDEQQLFADRTPMACAQRLHNLGVNEVIVKDGAKACLVCVEGQMESVAAEHVNVIVDSTAAGDSFNAGYLAARMQNQSPVDAARFAHRLAGTVVSYPGAIIPLASMPEL